jgi:hypothetical protein
MVISNPNRFNCPTSSLFLPKDEISQSLGLKDRLTSEAQSVFSNGQETQSSHETTSHIPEVTQK